MMSYLMQDEHGQVLEAHSISAGLDYPGIGPEHSHLSTSGRARYVAVTDAEVVEAFQLLSRTEGIIPALEPAHALAWVVREAPALAGRTVLLNLSGRGDKDVAQMMDLLGRMRSLEASAAGQPGRRPQAARALHHRWRRRAGRTPSGPPPWPAPTPSRSASRSPIR